MVDLVSYKKLELPIFREPLCYLQLFFVKCVLLISVFCICVFCSVRLRSVSGPGRLNELGSWIT